MTEKVGTSRGRSSRAVDEAARQATDADATQEAILHCKQMLVDLDRRRAQLSEGIAALRGRDATRSAARAEQVALCSDTRGDLQKRIARLTGMPTVSSGAPTNTPTDNTGLQQRRSSSDMWLLCAGGVFVRTTEAAALDKMLKDQCDAAVLTEDTHTELKSLSVQLAHLEGVDKALESINGPAM